MDSVPIPPQDDAVAPINSWSEQEIFDAVDYWGNAGRFHPGIYDQIATHLAQKNPGRNRTGMEIEMMFRWVRILRF